MKYFFILISVTLLSSCSSINLNKAMTLFNGSGNGLSTETIAQGLKEALSVGTKRTVSALSAKGGFANNKALSISTPVQMQKIKSTLKGLGLGKLVDIFEQKMNAAAEQASQQAAPIFTDAITSMGIDDAKSILSGGNNAATNYFKGKTSTSLRKLYSPIIKNSMNQTGVINAYNNIVNKYNSIPFTQKVDIKLEDYITTQALNGLFRTLAIEEAKIRQNPAARTSQLLKTVFGK